jgi:integrase
LIFPVIATRSHSQRRFSIVSEQTMSLTVKKVAKLMRRGVAGRYLDGGSTGVRGLYLIVGGKSNAHWELRYQQREVGHWMGLGSARDFTLTEARERARKERQRLHDGDDPLVLRRAERAAKAAAAASTRTFKQCAEGYIAAHSSAWKSAKHGQQWLASLQTYVFPKLANVDVAAIDRGRVLDVLEQKVEAQLGHPAGSFWQARSVTAGRVRLRIELILSWATARGYRNGENPAAWEHLRHILPAPAKVAPLEHHAAVPHGEVPGLLIELRKRDGVGPRALEFLILTAARAGEVLGATWSEIDLDQKIWTVPAERMKGHKEHRAPLSAAAVALLRGLPHERDNPHVFIGMRQPKLSEATMGRLFRDRLHRSETIHGFRSSFADWAHEQTAQPNHVIEMALSHSVGTAVEKAYRRTDLFAKRRQLMEQWGKYCTTAPVRRAATVTPLRPRADVS